jgi:hypothetical protein
MRVGRLYRRILGPLLFLLLFAGLAPVAFGQSAGPEVPLLQGAARYRNAAMCAYLAQHGDEWAAAYATPGAGLRLCDVIYGDWKHTVGRVRSEHDRAEWFYQALSAVVKLQGNLVADPEGGKLTYLPGDVGGLLGQVQAAVSGVQTLSDAVAAGNPAWQGLRLKAALLANSASVQNAMTMAKDYSFLSALSALNADQRSMVAAVPVASQEAMDMVDAIKASTTDPDLIAACDRLKTEYDTGRTDFLARALALVKEGGLTNYVAGKALQVGAAEGLSALLGAMGVAAGSAAVLTVVGTAVEGVNLCFTITGEDAAYDHARLAHFANATLPGLSDKWARLRPTASPDDPTACAQLDATSRALLLINAYVATEEHCIHVAYDQGALGRLQLTTPATGWAQVDEKVYPEAYRNWRSGELFADFAPALPGAGG